MQNAESPARARRAVVTVAAVVCAVAVLGASTTRGVAAPAFSHQTGELWIVPESDAGGTSPFAAAVADLSSGRAARALATFSSLTGDPALGGYALLYAGRAQAALGKWSDTAALAQQLLTREPEGYLGEAALWLAADAAENTGNLTAAIGSLRALTVSNPLAPERAWLRLGRAAERAGDKPLAAMALWKVYYDYPLSSEADDAALSLKALPLPAGRTAADRRQLNFRRAEQLLLAHRYSDARKAFDGLRLGATAEEKAGIQFRIAQCDLFLKHYATAREALRPFATEASPRQIEAKLSFASALRESGRIDEYQAFARKFAADSDGPLVEEALNDLGTYLLVRNEPDAAAAVFAEMFERFPNGAFAERAAWRSGWAAYRTGKLGEAIRTFDTAVAGLGRVDRRPSFMYWAARAHAQRGERDAAAAGYRQVVADYRNSYYGRLAQRDLESAGVSMRRGGPSDADEAEIDLPPGITGGKPPANAETIRRLLAAGLYDAAINELRKAQFDSGSSPMIEATIAYALNRKGELRPAITAMRRAYPQFIAEGGEALPPTMLSIIFPLTYWDDICERATERSLDPYLMAALIAQESTFDARVRSSAHAYGLMQILPSTGRLYAHRLGIRPFATSKLTDARTNIRIGMAVFSDLVQKFGGEVTQALAAYNAGDSRVVKWRAERTGIDRDEFVEDIPFPETQNYVKRIIGTAEDYRTLYRLKLR